MHGQVAPRQYAEELAVATQITPLLGVRAIEFDNEALLHPDGSERRYGDWTRNDVNPDSARPRYARLSGTK